MTELYFLDRDLAVTAGPADDFISLVWSERYFSCGEFTLVMPMTQQRFAAALTSAFLEVRGRHGLGRIEKVVYTGGGTMTVSGRMAESLLADRIVPRGTTVSGALCAAAEALVDVNAGTAAGERAIAHLTVETAATMYDGDGNVITVEDHLGGQQLDEWLYETLSAHGASFRIVPDYDAGTLVFQIYRGLDRTQAQSENGYAVFSASFASAGEFDFLSDSTDYRNFAYIAGEGEGEERVMLTLDLRTDADEPLRELYVDARDLRSSDGETTMSAEAYRNLLLSRGRQRLASHEAVVRVGGSAAVSVAEADSGFPTWGEAVPPVGARIGSAMTADVHYALGDLCDISSDAMGMVWSERVTEIDYVYEGDSIRVEPHFGTVYPDLRHYIRSCVDGRGSVRK
ncbi:MAG: siphovirus ReqiPepy6 Gp37-like family protein [Clostridia bacterium]|nr:siphovirus ReqiPepy6 Gp37-like family protein [Clostridia bacterium]